MDQWPHARPPNPKKWLHALSKAIADYPALIVADCIDPRVGLARIRDFPPTIAAVVEWCDARMSQYRNEADRDKIVRQKWDWWVKHKTWPFDGPDPNSAGCHVPPELRERWSQQQ